MLLQDELIVNNLVSNVFYFFRFLHYTLSEQSENKIIISFPYKRNKQWLTHNFEIKGNIKYIKGQIIIQTKDCFDLENENLFDLFFKIKDSQKIKRELQNSNDNVKMENVNVENNNIKTTNKSKIKIKNKQIFNLNTEFKSDTIDKMLPFELIENIDILPKTNKDYFELNETNLNIRYLTKDICGDPLEYLIVRQQNLNEYLDENMKYIQLQNNLKYSIFKSNKIKITLFNKFINYSLEKNYIKNVNNLIFEDEYLLMCDLTYKLVNLKINNSIYEMMNNFLNKIFDGFKLNKKDNIIIEPSIGFLNSFNKMKVPKVLFGIKLHVKQLKKNTYLYPFKFDICNDLNKLDIQSMLNYLLEYITNPNNLVSDQILKEIFYNNINQNLYNLFLENNLTYLQTTFALDYLLELSTNINKKMRKMEYLTDHLKKHLY